VINTQVVKVCN